MLCHHKYWLQEDVNLSILNSSNQYLLQWITSNFLNLIYNDHITWSLFIKFESVTIPLYLCVPYFFRLTFLGLFPRIPELRLHSSLISLTMVLSTRSSEFSSSGRTYSFLSARRLHNSSSCLRIVSCSRAISCLCSCLNSEKQTITGSQFTKGFVTNSFFCITVPHKTKVYFRIGYF